MEKGTILKVQPISCFGFFTAAATPAHSVPFLTANPHSKSSAPIPLVLLQQEEPRAPAARYADCGRAPVSGTEIPHHAILVLTPPRNQ